MVRRIPSRCRVPITDLPGSHVNLASDDRFDSSLFCFLIKLNRSVKIPVIRNCYGRHPQAFRFFHQLANPHRSVKSGIFSMKMKMNKGVGCHGILIYKPTPNVEVGILTSPNH